MVLCVQGQAISVVPLVEQAVCGGTGCISVAVTGGDPPYAFHWEPSPPAGQGTSMVCGLFPGDHTITVMDGSGNMEVLTITLNGTPGLIFDTDPGDPGVACGGTCSGYWSRSMPLGGVGPYTVTVDPPAGTAEAGANGIMVTGLCTGVVYSVTVSDANACSATINGVTVVDSGPPIEVSRTIQGVCQGFAQPFAQVVFDQPLSQVVLVSGAGTLSWNGTQLTIWGLGLGINVFNVFGVSPMCMSQLVIEVAVQPGPCGTVSGIVRADLDSDCSLDVDDPAVPYGLVRVQPGNFLAMTMADGRYTKDVAYAAYTVEHGFPGFDADCMVPYPVAVDVNAGQPEATADVLLTPVSGPDASALLGAWAFRPGFTSAYLVQVRNHNMYPMSDITLTLTYDPLLSFVSAEGSPTVLAPGALEWQIQELEPFVSVMHKVYVSVPANAALIGTPISATATLGQAMPDALPANDSYSITHTIIGSYDPNDKLVRTSSRTSEQYYFNGVDEHIDYTIRFQNTGTAEAINVYLIDTLDQLLDPASIELLGVSHTMVPSIENDRVLRFDFPNILLPDSAADLLGSQGFVSFRIKPSGTLPIGEVIANAADIYFDFNEPVRTNTTVLQVELPSRVQEQHGSRLLLAPNPATTLVRLSGLVGAPRSVQLVTMDGRTFTPKGWSPGDTVFDVASLAKGIYVVHVLDGLGYHQAMFAKD